MKLRITILLVAIFPALLPGAQNEDWFCKEAASQRTGNQIRSCGVGLGADENAARTSAFENAKKEFGGICAISADCRGHAITVQPERTSCEKEDKGYKCYRLLIFAIGESVEGDNGFSSSTANEVAQAEGKSSSSASSAALLVEPFDLDQRESLKPFYYRDIAHLPKIRIGMPKAAALAKFGKPNSVRELQGGTAVFYRTKPFCDGPSCSFRFDPNNGRVISFAEFKFEYTEALK